MKTCIFCEQENTAKSVEHIVSESLGNKFYVMERSTVCDICNSRFSGFEKKALANSIFVMGRVIHGVPSKKGKAAKGKIGNLEIQGHEGFVKGHLNIKGLEKDQLGNFNPTTGVGNLTIPTFDKSEDAAAKLLLKTGMESLYKSHPKIYDKYDFTETRQFLLGKQNSDWPILTSDFELEIFRSIPQLYDKERLMRFDCRLTFCELDEQTLLFKFKYGGIPMTINLLNRNLEWIKDILREDTLAMVYPEHYRKKSL